MNRVEEEIYNYWAHTHWLEGIHGNTSEKEDSNSEHNALYIETDPSGNKVEQAFIVKIEDYTPNSVIPNNTKEIDDKIKKAAKKIVNRIKQKERNGK